MHSVAFSLGRPLLSSVRVLFSLIATIVLVSPLPAQQTTQDPNVIGVLAQSITAMQTSSANFGSRSNFTFTATGTQVQSIADSAVENGFHVKIMGLSHLRWESTANLSTSITVVNGLSVSNQGSDGITQLSMSDRSGKTFEMFPFLALLDWTSNSDAIVSDEGVEVIEGVNLRHFLVERLPSELSDPDLQQAYRKMSRCEVYIDPASMLPVRIRYYEHPKDWRFDIPIDVVFSDFRSVNGVLMPFVSTRYLHGQEVDEFHFSTMTFGVSLSESDFSLVSQ